jgi:glucokinase
VIGIIDKTINPKMTQKKIVAGDVGGSHITLALFEQDSKGIQLIQIERENIDSFGSKSDILQNWTSGIRKFFSPGEAIFVSLAMPAPFDYQEGICLIKEQGKFINLYGVNIKKELSLSLSIPETSICFINDAQAFLLGESVFGRGKGIDSLLGITLGSGLGSAIKSGNEVRDAALWSVSFKESVAENYLGTSWFVKWAKSETGIDVAGVKELISHPFLKGRLEEVFDIYSTNLADFIQDQYSDLKMEKVIIGGNISLSSELFLDKTISKLGIAGLDIPIEVTQLGEKSALYGAAYICLNDGFKL